MQNERICSCRTVQRKMLILHSQINRRNAKVPILLLSGERRNKNLRTLLQKCICILFLISLFSFTAVLVICLRHPVPHVSEENVIKEYIPIIGKTFSLNIDHNDNFYLQTKSCTMCYSPDWEYKYSYIYSDSNMASLRLAITDQSLVYSRAEGYYQVIILFSGKLTKNTHAQYSLEKKNNNKMVITSKEETFILQTTPFFAKVVDQNNHVCWHSSYTGGLLLVCFVVSTFISVFGGVLFVAFSKEKRLKMFQSFKLA